MRRGAVLLTIPIALVFASSAWGAPAVEAYHMVYVRRALAAGMQVENRLEPMPPPGTYIYWRTAEQIGMHPGASEANRAVYTAPFVTPARSPAADIRVEFSGAQTGDVRFVEHVDLVPSALPGSADCLATGQRYSTEYGTIEPDGSMMSRGEGMVVYMSDPEYPKMAVSRGLTDVVPVKVLLCTSGRVLAAYPLTGYDNNWQPVEHERVMTEAAVTIVQSRTFAPLIKDGTPVAGWIHVHVGFRQ